ncbi:hypothetical protein GRF61_15385 [Azoarcus sp. TTM-91]|uniref:PRC-barrel domain-containing protein n=1 Tax=Azoarcus sp. TTM-91 TaxID=2691581 RepID=UPI00145E7FC8|nr:PRC-barrel domain-containing protein [Azoarcus sp. TTM-91]NMG35830.1 hypothetical protein [Azoarcus sp. TTM-91]
MTASTPFRNGLAGLGPAQAGEEPATSVGSETGRAGEVDPFVGSAEVPPDAAASGEIQDPARARPPSGRGDGDVIAVDRLQGQEVSGAAGVLLGRVRHVLADLTGGRIAFLVLELDGRGGDWLCAVPWPAFRRKEDRLSLPHGAEELRQAPGFAADSWPSFADPDWLEQLYFFFDCMPYWVADRR